MERVRKSWDKWRSTTSICGPKVGWPGLKIPNRHYTTPYSTLAILHVSHNREWTWSCGLSWQWNEVEDS